MWRRRLGFILVFAFIIPILGSICLCPAAVVLECLDIRLGLGPFAIGRCLAGAVCEDL